jgi:hypothetical protein
MNKHAKLALSKIASSVVLALSCQAASAVEIWPDLTGVGEFAPVVQETSKVLAPQELAGPVYTDLADKLNHLESSLASTTDVHYYSFTALRGQKVIVAWKEGVAVPPNVQFEYFDKGGWNIKQLGGRYVFSEIKPGQALKIRLSQKQGLPFAQGQKYDIFFGSYPVLKKYALKDEAGVLKIPAGYSDLRWDTVQAYTDVTMEAFFTDTKNAPLEGAVARLKLELNESRIPLINSDAESDSAGRISQLVNMGRCVGGFEAKDFTRYDHGHNTWRTYYYKGSWLIYNRLLGNQSLLESFPDQGTIGHICKHRLIRSVPGPA